jgi:hypothetical protein
MPKKFKKLLKSCISANPEDQKDQQAQAAASLRTEGNDVSSSTSLETKTDKVNTLTITPQSPQTVKSKPMDVNSAHSSSDVENSQSYVINSQVLEQARLKLKKKEDSASRPNALENQPSELKEKLAERRKWEETANNPNEVQKQLPMSTRFNDTPKTEPSELERKLAERRAWEDAEAASRINKSKKQEKVQEQLPISNNKELHNEYEKLTQSLEHLKSSLPDSCDSKFELPKSGSLSDKLAELKERLELLQLELDETNVLSKKDEVEETINFRILNEQDPEQLYQRKAWGLSIIDEQGESRANSMFINPSNDLTPRASILQPKNRFGSFFQSPTEPEQMKNLNTVTITPKKGF